MKRNKKTKKQKVKALDDVIEEFEKSGLSMSEFRKKHLLEDYVESGNKELADIVADYFIEHLE